MTTSTTLQLLTADWLVIDATLDSHVSVAAENGDPDDVVALARSIRQAGWDHLPDWPRDVEGFQRWPPAGHTATLTLTTAQWDLVLSALDYWAAVADRLGPGHAGDAVRSRDIATAIRAQRGSTA